MVRLTVLAAVAALAAAVVATPLEKRQNCGALYAQCGGNGFTGPTCCSQGACVCQNQYYCQCVPGTASTTAGPASPSPVRSTTTGACSAVTVTVPTTVTVVTTVTAPCASSSAPTSSPRTTPVSTSPRASSTTPAVVTSSPRVTTTGGVNTATATVSGAVVSPTVTPYVAPNLGPNKAGNPYFGIPRFVNPNNADNIEKARQASTDATFRARAERLKPYPTFRWFDTMSSLQTLPSYLAAAEAQAAGSELIVEIVVYNLPGRDCAADASNGEIMAGGINTYKTQYIDVMVSMLRRKASNIRIIALIEPDSLPNLATNMGILRCNATTQAEYPAGIGYAIAQLATIPNLYQYLDAAHGGWLGWPDNQQKIVPIFQNALNIARQQNPSASIRGFASNTANYGAFYGNGTCPAKEKCPLLNQNGQLLYDWNPCIDEDLYTRTLSSVFAANNLPAFWIHDSARGGVHGVRNLWGSWCNIKLTGIGLRPGNNPTPAVDALVWVKPPGESDGVSIPGSPRLDRNCDPTNTVRGPTGASGENSWANAPQAGMWFQAAFEELVTLANPPL